MRNDVAVLPAGVYFRTALSCPGCPMPAAVVVGGVFEKESQAVASAALWQEQGLPPGYPFFAHSHELGLVSAERGIVVVVAMFESLQDAEAWQAEVGSARSEVLTLLDEETMYGQQASLVPDAERLRAVEVHPGEPVAAYDAAVVDRAEEQGDEVTLAPLCHIDGGSVFLATEAEISRTLYSWAPVRCGAKPAYVRWREVRLWSTVKRISDGAQLLQIVGASHDGLVIERRTYEPQQW